MASPAAAVLTASFETKIPARMDRLPWSRWHWRVVIALGITWLLDGLEVTLIGAVGSILKRPETLHFTDAQIGQLGSAYLAGAVLGSLFFGHLTDKLGRKPLFTVTLGLYLAAAGLSAFSWNFWSFAVFRFLTGAGLGGEYAAINSAIDEMIPARVRGWADLAINASYWLGAAAGAVATIWLLDPRVLPINIGWRVGFFAGALLGLIIIAFRKYVPESPRWLMIRGERDEAERIVADIESQVRAEHGDASLEEPSRSITIVPRNDIGFGMIARAMLYQYWRRTLLGLFLMVSQAYLYNAIFFTYGLVLTKFYHVPDADTGLYLLPFALGNFLGPLLLGHLFDSWGRKPMIALTYGASAVLLAVTAYLFQAQMLTATTQTVLWSVIFFFASAASSAAYLTVSEIFPLEMRAMAIALFYSAGTAIGGVFAPWIFGWLIETGSRFNVFLGFLSASLLLAVSVVVVALYGVKAERASLEDIAEPLSVGHTG